MSDPRNYCRIHGAPFVREEQIADPSCVLFRVTYECACTEVIQKTTNWKAERDRDAAKKLVRPRIESMREEIVQACLYMPKYPKSQFNQRGFCEIMRDKAERLRGLERE